jgi:transcriptional regulator with XRE-family HTH domain
MIGERLIQAIRDTGLSQREVSRIAGVDETLVSRFMRGQREPCFKTLDQLLDALGLEVVVRPRRPARKDG